MNQSVYNFYVGRVKSAPSYGFISGHEIIKVVCKTAFNDLLLTDEEFISIINLCHLAHIKMMEDNYNDGWNE